MRRLTPFEKKIVKKIATYNIITYSTIEDILKEEIGENVAFRFTIEDLAIGQKVGVYVYYFVNGACLVNNDTAGNLVKIYATLIETVQLLDILIENRLVNFKVRVPNFNDRIGYINKKALESNAVSANNTSPLIDMLSEVELLEKITNRTYYPAQALHIFIKNKFRTEEQKQNDVNKLIGYGTLFFAAAGLMLTGLFSYLTYFDTLNSRVEEKDIKHKNEIASERKEVLEERFRNILLSKVDSLTKFIQVNNNVIK